MKSSVLHQMIRISLFLVLFASSHLASAQSGKIAGTVIDDLTGDPLPGVNITIQGTTQGTSTDLDGNYVIIGIRPGTYAIEASYIGFATQVVSGVRVNIDLTSRVDFTMTEEVIAGEEVVIVAERPMIQKDVTATTAVVSGDQIRAIPVENFGDVVELQAGVVDGHFRGGRTGEVGYWVDGLPVTDVYNGGLTLAIENNTVEELQVVTGAFNAEYGQAMSGIVNVVTRDGSNKLSGGVSYFTGDYAVANTAIFQELGGIEPGVVQNVEADFSGPILKEKLFFFVSGRYFSNDGWFTGRNVYGFNDVGKDVNTGRLLRKESIGLSNAGDSSLVNMNPFERRSGQAKLTWRVWWVTSFPRRRSLSSIAMTSPTSQTPVSMEETRLSPPTSNLPTRSQTLRSTRWATRTRSVNTSNICSKPPTTRGIAIANSLSSPTTYTPQGFAWAARTTPDSHGPRRPTS
ncbi:MAG: TonB-dependent receptor [Bacteroidetes bacterium]|nr:TonB-dependent receptor [Bacteroidota bacterium]